MNDDDVLTDDTLPEGSLVAAVDLGSNSFHLLVARIEHGEIRPVETLAEKVQLAAGQDEGILSADAIARGLDCLSRFAQLLNSLSIERVRVVGTHALRTADNRREFTVPANALLGTPVEVIYGREEARLVYVGVAHTLADDAQSRLVVDIGGGSTEFIIGERFEPVELESLQMGCVSYSQLFFADGQLSAQAMRRAYQRATIELAALRRRFTPERWVECVGSSGTLQAIEEILVQQGWSEGDINPEGLVALEQRLLKFSSMEDIVLSGLADNRRNVIAAGVAITRAIFDTLQVKLMRTSKGALREGVLYDLLGRLSHEDVRERSVGALMSRYGVDESVVAAVERRARVFYRATRLNWNLSRHDWELLRWASRAHEIGMAISHKHYNRHSAYLLRNTDLPGFSQDEQNQIALLCLGHRGKLNDNLWLDIAEADRPAYSPLITIMRLATLFKYVEQLEQLPEFTVQAEASSLQLGFPTDWLEQHPLTAAELEREQNQLNKIGISLKLS